jgi:O-antigen/teichoic acid export membrane protein
MSESTIELTGPNAAADSAPEVPGGAQTVSRFAAKSIRANAIWMLSGNTIYAASRWFVLVMVAKLGSQEMLGQYSWALAFALPTVTICRFGVRTLVATDARRELPIGDYLGFALGGSLIGFAIVIGLAITERSDQQTMILLTLVAIWNSLESISDVFAGLFTRDERMDLYAKALMLQAASICVLLSVGLVLGKGLSWGVAGLVIAAAIRLVAYEWPVAKRHCSSESINSTASSAHLVPTLHWTAIRHIFSMGIWLAIVMYILALTDAVPRYVIKDRLGDARLGAFAALSSVTVAVNLLVLSVCQSMSSRLAVLFVTNERAEFSRLCLRAIGLALLVGLLGLIVAFFFGRQILALAFKPEYSADIAAFLVILLSTVILNVGSIVGTAITSMRRLAIVVPIQLLRLSIIYFGSLLVIDRYGLVGVAWVMVAAAVVLTAALAALVWWHLRLMPTAEASAT